MTDAAPGATSGWVGQFIFGRPLHDRAPNNLALVRFAAAAAVLFAHSWPIALGPAGVDPVTQNLRAWFGEGVALSAFAVHTFFVISGYLVTRSALSRGGVGGFALARALRIYPALVVNILITAVIVGACVTTLSVTDYFAHGQFWKFVINNVFSWNVIYGLPGVFTGNPLTAVNGSLWTLPLEIRCYVFVGLALAIGLLKRGRLFTVLALALVLGDGLFRARGFLGADAAATCIAYFLIGGVLCINRLPTSPVLALVLLVLSAVIPVEAVARLSLIAGWALFALWIGIAAPRIPWPEKRIGDPSYGIYIYAFPLQQLVVLWLGADAPWTVAGVAGAATFIAGVVSWKYLEAPMLAFKSKSITATRAVVAPVQTSGVEL